MLCISTSKCMLAHAFAWSNTTKNIYIQRFIPSAVFYKSVSTLGYQLKSPQHRSFIQGILSTSKKSWADLHPHLFVLEVQDQTKFT